MKRLPSFIYGYKDDKKSPYFSEYDYINSSDALIRDYSFEDVLSIDQINRCKCALGNEKNEDIEELESYPSIPQNIRHKCTTENSASNYHLDCVNSTMSSGECKTNLDFHKKSNLHLNKNEDVSIALKRHHTVEKSVSLDRGNVRNFPNVKENLISFCEREKKTSAEYSDKKIKSNDKSISTQIRKRRTTSLKDMPADFLFLLLPLLDNQSILALRSTSRYYHRIASNPFHWRERCLKIWNLPQSIFLNPFSSNKSRIKDEDLSIRIDKKNNTNHRNTENDTDMDFQTSRESYTSNGRKECNTPRFNIVSSERKESERNKSYDNDKFVDFISKKISMVHLHPLCHPMPYGLEIADNSSESDTEDTYLETPEESIVPEDDQTNESTSTEYNILNNQNVSRTLNYEIPNVGRNSNTVEGEMNRGIHQGVDLSLIDTLRHGRSSNLLPLPNRVDRGYRRRQNTSDSSPSTMSSATTAPSSSSRRESIPFFEGTHYDDDDNYQGEKCDFYSDDDYDDGNNKTEDSDVSSSDLFSEDDPLDNIYEEVFGKLEWEFSRIEFPMTMNSFLAQGRARFDMLPKLKISNQRRSYSRDDEFNNPRNQDSRISVDNNTTHIVNGATLDANSRHENVNGPLVSPLVWINDGNETSEERLESNNGTVAEALTRHIEGHHSVSSMGNGYNVHTNYLERMSYVGEDYPRGGNRAIRTHIPFPPLLEKADFNLPKDKEIYPPFPWSFWQNVFSLEMATTNSSFFLSKRPISKFDLVDTRAILSSSFPSTSFMKLPRSLPFTIPATSLTDYLRSTAILPSANGDKNEEDTDNTMSPFHRSFFASSSLPSMSRIGILDSLCPSPKIDDVNHEVTTPKPIKRISSVERIKNVHEKFIASTLSAHIRPFSIPWMSKYGQYNVEPRYVAYYEVTLSETAPEGECSDNLSDSIYRENRSNVTRNRLMNHYHRQDDLNDNTSNSNAYQKQCIAVGLSSKSFPLKGLMTGWDSNSYGYHSDDGGIFHGTGIKVRYYGPTFGAGDTIGCGINYLSRDIFYTLNGTYLGIAFTNVNGTLYPTVGVDTTYCIDFNMGKSSFVFDLQSYLDDH